MKNKILILLLLNFLFSFAQKSLDSLKTDDNYKFHYKQLIIPTALIAYGVVGQDNKLIKSFNNDIQEEIIEDIDKKITVDDFMQHAPLAAVYTLNLVGIEGKNNFKDRTIIIGTSYLIMAATVTSMKSMTKVMRPDGTSDNSFPSGHTATAFANAEFMWQEYKDKSIWYGVSGYIAAAGTGVFRMYNNRHWLTDVATGAGIGILSTKAAYWIFPFINEKIFKSKKSSTAMALPFYNGKQAGVAFSLQF